MLGRAHRVDGLHRAAEDDVTRLKGRPVVTLVVVTVALFTDSLLYGLVIPLASESPARIESEWVLGVMYGAYALGLLATTPLFGALSDRRGRRLPMIAGVLLQGAATLLFALATTVGPPGRSGSRWWPIPTPSGAPR